eukprot:7387991-Pyramimonas_sp.AAC.1
MAPSRWETVGNASIGYRMSLWRDDEPPTACCQRELGGHYNPTVLGNQPETHQTLVINESEAGSAAPSRAPSQGPSTISWQVLSTSDLDQIAAALNPEQVEQLADRLYQQDPQAAGQGAMSAMVTRNRQAVQGNLPVNGLRSDMPEPQGDPQTFGRILGEPPRFE